MALRGAGESAKVLHLAELLAINESWALGICENMWQATALYEPDGGIGRQRDAAIARWCKWPVGEAGRLIASLLEARLLDQVDEGWKHWGREYADQGCRLYVHNHHIRAQDGVQQQVARGYAKQARAGVFACGCPSQRLGPKGWTRWAYDQWMAGTWDGLRRAPAGQALEKGESEFLQGVLSCPTISDGVGLPVPVPVPMPVPDLENRTPLGGEGGLGVDKSGEGHGGEGSGVRKEGAGAPEPPPNPKRGGLRHDGGDTWRGGDRKPLARQTAAAAICDGPDGVEASTVAQRPGELWKGKEGASAGARAVPEDSAGENGAKPAGEVSEERKAELAAMLKAGWERLRLCPGTIDGARLFFEDLLDARGVGWLVLEKWRREYPRVDVAAEARTALNWCEAHCDGEDWSLGQKYKPLAFFLAWLVRQDRTAEDPVRDAIARAGQAAAQRGKVAVTAGGGNAAGAKPIRRFTHACAELRQLFSQEYCERWLWNCTVMLSGRRAVMFVPVVGGAEKLGENEKIIRGAFGVDEIEFQQTAELVKVMCA